MIVTMAISLGCQQSVLILISSFGIGIKNSLRK